MNALACAVGLFVIAILLSFLRVSYEGFIGSPDARRCGVDEPPCLFGQACMNGWCVENAPPPVPQSTGLPVLPEGKQY
jgi:hypothetical protein